MEACEYCKSHESVMWSLSDGFICAPCEEKRRAIERQKELDDEADKLQAEREKYLYWHE